MTLAEKLQQARTGAAFGPALTRGLLRLTGKHRLGFLHRISTQALSKLGPGMSAYTAFLDVKAHLAGEGMVLVRDDDVVLDVAPEARDAVAAYLRKYIIMDDVKVHPFPDDVRVVPVFGASGIAAGMAAAGDVPSFATARHGEPARDFVVAPADAARLVDALRAAGAVELSGSELEAMRIAAGVPRWGAELDDARLVLETSVVAAAVAFDKGCYIGQEIVARGTFRGQVQRGLVQLELPPGTSAPAPLSVDGQHVGDVTSAADTPEGRLGLGYLRRAWWTPGQRLAVAGGEAIVRRPLVQDGMEPPAPRGGLLSRPPATR